MLGRLARWLRVLGYDTIYDERLHDHALVRLSRREERILLTRDRHLLRELRPERAIEVRQDAPLEQLRDVVAALSLPPPTAMFTRCLICNTLLSEDLPADQAAALVPPDFESIPPSVRRCPGCGKVYWSGSHVRRMRAALERGLPGWI